MDIITGFFELIVLTLPFTIVFGAVSLFLIAVLFILVRPLLLIGVLFDLIDIDDIIDCFSKKDEDDSDEEENDN